MATLSPSSRAEAVGTHHASDDPSDDDSLLTDSGLAQRILANPGVLLVAALTAIALVSERSLLGSGPLGGGALLPAWGGASGLWSEYLASFHAVGAGSAASTPPYVAVVAAGSTILGGKPWLAMAVILLGCVPIAGAVDLPRVKAAHRPARRSGCGWPPPTPCSGGHRDCRGGQVRRGGGLHAAAGHRLTAGRMLTERPRRARRAAWATGLLIAIAAAFVPLVWVVAVIVAALTGLAFARARRAMAVNLAIVALVPPVLLAPWTLDVAEHPSVLLFEAGLQQPGLASANLPARSVLLLSPGGPGLPPVWVTGGLLLAALAALLLRRRGFAVATSWGVALSGLLTAIAVSRFLVRPPGGGPVLPVWPGVALIVAALGLLLAVAAAGDDVHALFAAGGLRRAGVCALAIAACALPVLTAAYWIVTGVSGPVSNVAAPVLPEFVSISTGSGLHLRTLVLRPGARSVSYTLLRGADPPIGAEALTEPPAAARALDRVVAGLTAQHGTEAGDVGGSLAQFAVGYVLLPAPVDPGLARLLDGVAGLRPVSQTSSFALWRVGEPAGRARVIEPSGAQVSLASGAVSVNGAAAPAAGGTLVLAEPASASWHASLNGRPLTPLPRPAYGWAQAFRLPAGGGRLDIARDQTGREVMVALEAVILVVVAALALPGAQDSAPDAGEPGGEDQPHRTSHMAAAGARGHDRTAGPRRGSRGTRTRGRRRRDADEGYGAGPRRGPHAAGHPPAGGQRRASPLPRDLALPGRLPVPSDPMAQDLGAADGGSGVQDPVAVREETFGEAGRVPGEPAGRAREADR